MKQHSEKFNFIPHEISSDFIFVTRPSLENFSDDSNSTQIGRACDSTQTMTQPTWPDQITAIDRQRSMHCSKTLSAMNSSFGKSLEDFISRSLIKKYTKIPTHWISILRVGVAIPPPNSKMVSASTYFLGNDKMPACWALGLLFE